MPRAHEAWLGFTLLCRAAQTSWDFVWPTYQCRNFSVLLMTHIKKAVPSLRVFGIWIPAFQAALNGRVHHRAADAAVRMIIE